VPFRRAALAVALLFVASALLWASRAAADFFSQSPGPLAEAHRAIDTSEQCDKCHTDGRKLSNEKCLACHEPIKKRQLSGHGFHASGRVAGKQCFLCHTDHKGRGRDILGFAALGGRDRFEHAETGWPLRQKHAGVECAKCHDQRIEGRATYLKAPLDCAGCHKQPHGELRVGLKRCERCHDAASWKEIARPEFDHNKAADARYPIEAKHQGVACLKCHAKWVFRSSFSAPDCAPCHQNVHGDSLFGRKRCAFCHSARVDWRRISFDHARQTRFPLDGAHAGKACATCHPKETRQKPGRDCASCHKDVHNARFKAQGDCATCHTSVDWKAEIRFDHRTRTRFQLTGAHSDVDCRACHRGRSPAEWERFDARTVGCMGCHQHANVHKRQFKDSECLRCHTMAGENKFKKQAVNQFHGPASRFPLTEGHGGVACDKCHKNDVYQGTPLVCGPTCHADALHKGSLGEQCLNCHAGGHWAATRFDHDQSSFPLIGHHQDVRCEACHPARRFKPLDRRCAGCHKDDDAHGGTLGERCELCHSPTGRSLFDHNDPRAPTRFRIDGAHLHVRCAACHKDTQFARTPRECESCHPDPDAHKGQLGTRCAACHQTSDWKTVHTGHNTPAFRFGGAHDRVACVYCHPGGQVRRNTGQLCGSCHQNDDIHHNSLGPRCGECHTQQSFAPARFFHERVGCDLRGIHRTLPCNDCHVGGHFAALSPSCVSCHRTDAVKAAMNDPRSGGPAHATYTTCSMCHNPSFFAPAPKPSGSESVCR
jgi:hypothetical protein